MAVKLVVFAVILYWIIRAAINLWRAALADPHANRIQTERTGDEDVRRVVHGNTYEQTWHVRRSGSGASPRESVEDAHWQDV